MVSCCPAAVRSFVKACGCCLQCVGAEYCCVTLQMSEQLGSTAQQLWSHTVLANMQQQLPSTANLSLCSMSAVAMSSNRQNVAVLASASDGDLPLQLLSVSPDSKPEELSTHELDLGQDARAEGSKKGSKWQCCCSRHGEVLIWRQGGSAHRWTLQKGEAIWC